MTAAVSLTVVASLCAAAESPATKPVPELDQQQARQWARFWEEQEAMAVLMELSRTLPPDAGLPLAIEGATVIPMSGDAVLEDHTVLVRDGRIAWVGPRGEARLPESTRRVSVAGRFLIPGLTESHSHTIHSPSQLLVYLTRGVTTLREMDGYPWMLEARAAANRGALLIPNLYVSGHILSHRPFDFYMTGVDTEEQARTLVREQAAAGYDFIKIHNSMPEPLFSAIFEAARETGLDVAGHIPNEIKIADAIAAGMRTNEHFKGYIFDQTLDITDQDYIAATRGSELWNTPTFTTYHDHLRGAASRELAEKEGSLGLVPRWLRGTWRRASDQEVDRLTELRQSVYPKSRQIFTALRGVTDRFLAGTDTGSYSYMVPGFALQEEVRIFESLGLAPLEALRTATINPARALRREREFGSIESGKRADLVLLERSPLEGTEQLARVVGVSVRGVWLDERALATIRSRLEAVFSDALETPQPSRAALERLVREAGDLVSAGWPYPRYILEEIADWLEAIEQPDLAASIRRLRASG